MAIYELQRDKISRLAETTFGSEGVRERGDLQRLLQTNVEVISPDTLVLAEEFGEWSDSRRRIDLLGIDKDANLVVIELKRSEDGGFMELQAIRYAAMVSTMTFEQAVAARTAYQSRHAIEGGAREAILGFLEWEQPQEDQFAQAVRVVLVAGDFSKELTSSVMWLNSFDLDIRCVRLRPYTLDGRLILDVQQIIPLPEAAEYQVQVREKSQRERQARESNIDWTRFDVSIRGESHQGLWKRGAILVVAKKLLVNGISPERIAASLQRPMHRLWRSVEGDVGATDFRMRAASDARDGATFDDKRWFCADDSDLMHVNGRTYAFSNQWGGADWHNAMKQFVAAFPEMEISYRPNAESDGGP